MKSIDIDVEESVYTYYMYESISEISNAIKKYLCNIAIHY